MRLSTAGQQAQRFQYPDDDDETGPEVRLLNHGRSMDGHRLAFQSVALVAMIVTPEQAAATIAQYSDAEIAEAKRVMALARID